MSVSYEDVSYAIDEQYLSPYAPFFILDAPSTTFNTASATPLNVVCQRLQLLDSVASSTPISIAWTALVLCQHNLPQEHLLPYIPHQGRHKALVSVVGHLLGTRATYDLLRDYMRHYRYKYWPLSSLQEWPVAVYTNGELVRAVFLEAARRCTSGDTSKKMTGDELAKLVASLSAPARYSHKADCRRKRSKTERLEASRQRQNHADDEGNGDENGDSINNADDDGDTITIQPPAPSVPIAPAVAHSPLSPAVSIADNDNANNELVDGKENGDDGDSINNANDDTQPSASSVPIAPAVHVDDDDSEDESENTVVSTYEWLGLQNEVKQLRLFKTDRLVQERLLQKVYAVGERVVSAGEGLQHDLQQLQAYQKRQIEGLLTWRVTGIELSVWEAKDGRVRMRAMKLLRFMYDHVTDYTELLAFKLWETRNIPWSLLNRLDAYLQKRHGFQPEIPKDFVL